MERETGISVEAKEIVRKVTAFVAQYLAGNLSVDGATIKGGALLNLQIRLDADSVRVSIADPRPVIDKTFGPLSFAGRLKAFTVNDREAHVEIDGLPDQTIKLK